LTHGVVIQETDSRITGRVARCCQRGVVEGWSYRIQG
jgi:hypothetical protein